MNEATVNASAGQAATVAASGPRGSPDMTLAYSVPATPRATPIHPSRDPASRITDPATISPSTASGSRRASVMDCPVRRPRASIWE
jgi:hypothetical protein